MEDDEDYKLSSLKYYKKPLQTYRQNLFSSKFEIYLFFIAHCLFILTGLTCSQPVTANSVSKISDELSHHLTNTFKDATKYNDIIRVYENLADPEIFNPKKDLEDITKKIEKYLSERAKMAWDAKVSLESRDLGNYSYIELNDPISRNFVRYINAKTGHDGTYVYTDGHFGTTTYVNETRVLNLESNVNFYRIPTSSEASAIHIPTPVYNRNGELLQKIQWSDIDQLYRRNREKIKDLSFQKFCSDSGFLRYFPSAPWIYDNPQTQLDMFDCRNTEWFIDAATNSKNVIIMLDMSGSMLGQRFEIAKQTIEAILETLSDNDFFNILSFSKTPQLLDDCSEEGLLQATMRNKKLLRTRLINVTSEGKAEYEKALAKAFQTLLNLPDPATWKTKEDIVKEEEEKSIDPNLRYIELKDNILVLTNRHLNAIKDGDRMTKTQMGCNDVIMLITDGAPNYYKEVFELYNPEKRVRFFSFLIGEEAKDFDQVKWMACNNRGYMVHVSSMADVQEKVQHYVKIMSRPISRQSHSIHRENAVWGSVSKERMSNQYVISVGYPVILEEQFMGVAAVSVPMVELMQIAHPSLLGPKSYFFMLDNNGYTMFHPQLRQTDIITKETKPTYNNMDFIHVEVQKPLSELKNFVLINCDIPTNTKMSVLYAIDNLKRVYQQTNSYISECIAGTHFTIGAAINDNEHVRLKHRGKIDYNKIQLSWFQDNNWRIHPEWRYCLLNDSDTMLSPEAALSTYAEQMKFTNKLPELCMPRKSIVDRLLLDIQATTSFADLWDQEWKKNKKNGIHLAFFATPSGLIRYFNESLEDLYYEESETGYENVTDKSYKHFILELNKRSVDDEYFKRAIRMKEKIVFDVNYYSNLWHVSDATTAYGKNENISLLALGYKALYHDQALIGVVGIEFVYDRIPDYLRKHGCNPQNDQIRCFLLDEHGYIFYSSQKDVSYDETIHTYEYNHINPKFARKTLIGSFFGHLNRVTEWTMDMLIKKGFYKQIKFVDNQAMCDIEPIITAASSTISLPFNHIYKILLRFIYRIIQLLTEYIAVFMGTAVFSTLKSVDGYTSTFKTPLGGRLPCQKESIYYLSDNDNVKMMSSSILEGGSAERPCKQNAAQCAIRVYASWVENTNLLLVVISQDKKSSCYDDTHCPMSDPPLIPFSFVKTGTIQNPSESNTHPEMDNMGKNRICQSPLPIKRKNVLQCFKEEYVDESNLPCSLSNNRHSLSFVLLVMCLLQINRIIF